MTEWARSRLPRSSTSSTTAGGAVVPTPSSVDAQALPNIIAFGAARNVHDYRLADDYVVRLACGIGLAHVFLRVSIDGLSEVEIRRSGGRKWSSCWPVHWFETRRHEQAAGHCNCLKLSTVSATRKLRPLARS